MAIQFYLTDAGKNAALNAASLGLNVSLSHIAVGTAKYNPQTALGNTALIAEVDRFLLNGGSVEPNSHTLRFVSNIEPIVTADAFEIGLYTDTGVLFAIASTTGNDPLIRLVANIVSITTFGMILSTLDLTNLIITVDPNTPICVALMNQHLDHPDPHPQYSKKIDTDAALLALKVTTITAGAGLTGGGDLSENRTVTLGTPSTITGTTTNSVTADSHTHEIEFPEGVDISGKYDKTGGELNGNILLKGYLELTGGRTVAKLYAADCLRLELNYPLLINDAVNVRNVVSATDLTVSDNGSTSITHSNTQVEGNFVRFSSARDKYVFDKPIHAPSFVGGNVSIAANGYTSLPNGLIMQWGKHEDNSAVNTHVTFPIAFPTACLNISATAENTDGARAEIVNFYNVNTTGFDWAGASGSGGVVQAVVHGHWLAIGY